MAAKEQVPRLCSEPFRFWRFNLSALQKASFLVSRLRQLLIASRRSRLACPLWSYPLTFIQPAVCYHLRKRQREIQVFPRRLRMTPNKFPKSQRRIFAPLRSSQSEDVVGDMFKCDQNDEIVIESDVRDRRRRDGWEAKRKFEGSQPSRTLQMRNIMRFRPKQVGRNVILAEGCGKTIEAIL